MTDEIKLGDVFYQLNPDVSFADFGGKAHLWGRIEYGEFEVVKVNPKSVRTKSLITIGCLWGNKWRKETLLKMPRTKEKLLKIVKERNNDWIKAYSKEKGKYTVKAWQYYVVEVWIFAFRQLGVVAASGLDLKTIKAADKAVETLAKKNEAKIKKLRGQ